MTSVTLHVYDVANTENENLNDFLKVLHLDYRIYW